MFPKLAFGVIVVPSGITKNWEGLGIATGNQVRD